VTRSCEIRNKPLHSIKYGNFPDSTRNSSVLLKHCAPIKISGNLMNGYFLIFCYLQYSHGAMFARPEQSPPIYVTKVHPQISSDKYPSNTLWQTTADALKLHTPSNFIWVGDTITENISPKITFWVDLHLSAFVPKFTNLHN